MGEILENNSEDKYFPIAKDPNSSLYIVKGGPTGSPYVEGVSSSRITDSIMNQESLLLKKELIDALDVHTKGAFVGALVSFVIMELCGSFITGKTGGWKDSSENFKEFCKLYMPEDYNKISGLLYDIFRCGLAHSYIAKGAARLGENTADAIDHLEFYKDGLYIHVPKLAADVKNGLNKLFSELDKNKYNSVLKKLHDDGRQKYDTFLKNNPEIVLKPGEIKGDVILYID